MCESVRTLKKPYLQLDLVHEVPDEDYQGMSVGMPPVCIMCKLGTDGPTKHGSECLCLSCYEIISQWGRRILKLLED